MEEIIFDEAFMGQLTNLKMALALKLHEGMQGGRRSSAKGSSLEFSDFREYGPGDDFRRIDWAAYGRLDKLFVKVFMEEKEAVFNLFIDQSKSMSFGSPSKGKTSLQIVAALSYIIMSKQDRVKVCLLGGQTTSNIEDKKFISNKIIPSMGRQGFHQLLEQLARVRFEGKEALCTQLLREPIRGKGVSIIVSDFLFETGLEQLEKALGYLRYKKQQVILIQVLCKEEREPEETGDFEFIDSETGKSVRLTLNPKLIEAYKERLRSHQTSLERLSQKYGIQYMAIDAEASIEQIILKEFYNKQIIF